MMDGVAILAAIVARFDTSMAPGQVRAHKSALCEHLEHHGARYAARMCQQWYHMTSYAAPTHCEGE